MEFGVKDVNWMLVGAWTAGLATKKAYWVRSSDCLLFLFVYVGLQRFLFSGYNDICHFDLLKSDLKNHIEKGD